jgi:hypothetical protein
MLQPGHLRTTDSVALTGQDHTGASYVLGRRGARSSRSGVNPGRCRISTFQARRRWRPRPVDVRSAGSDECEVVLRDLEHFLMQHDNNAGRHARLLRAAGAHRGGCNVRLRDRGTRLDFGSTTGRAIPALTADGSRGRSRMNYRDGRAWDASTKPLTAQHEMQRARNCRVA